MAGERFIQEDKYPKVTLFQVSIFRKAFFFFFSLWQECVVEGEADVSLCMPFPEAFTDKELL